MIENAVAGRVLEYLEGGLDFETRQRIDWRVGAMLNQLRYFEEAQNPGLKHVKDQGWSMDRLAVICVLNSFYQIVLAPLSAWANTDVEIGIGRRIPISYGTLRFDEDRRRRTLSALLTYLDIVKDLGLPRTALRANHAEDLLAVLLSIEDVDEPA